MSVIAMQSGQLAVKVDDVRNVLTIEQRGELLPWTFDLSKAAIGVCPAGGGGKPTDPAWEPWYYVPGPGPLGQGTPVHLNELTLRRLSATHFQWIGEVAGAGLALEIELDGGAVVFSVSPLGTGKQEVAWAIWPGEVSFQGVAREACLGAYEQGHVFRSDGKPWRHEMDWRATAIRLYGFTVGQQSLAAIVETPMDARLNVDDDGRSAMRSVLTFGPSMGTLGYSRSVRFVPLGAGGYVAVADALRQYLQRNGMWLSWEDRVAANPAVERLKGAFISCAGYFHDDGADQLAVMRAMKNLGFERGYLFSPRLCCFGDEWRVHGMSYNDVDDGAIAAIQDLGYVCAPFLQVEQAGPSIGQEKFAVRADGKRLLRWEVGERKYWEIAKWRVPSMLPQFDQALEGSLGVHFDTLTAAGLIEHHGHRQYDHSGDVRLRMEVADYYRRRGKIIAAEGMRDWANLHCDLTTSRTYLPTSDHTGRLWNAPLADLVYHDSIIRCNWEHHSYDCEEGLSTLFRKRYHPFAHELSDLLNATPPVLFLEGALYAYELKEVTLPDGTKEVENDVTRSHPVHKRFSDPLTQAALPKALRVCQLNMRHGTARMIAHRFVEGGGPLVQESEFASGLHVVVNFGDDPFTLPDGKTIQARSAIVEE